MEQSLSFQKPVINVRLPNPELETYIEKYIYRRITIPKGFRIHQNTASLRSTGSIDFFLGERFEIIDFKTGVPSPFLRCMVRVPQTNPLYFLHLEGEFISFTIKFKATGFYRLMGVPMDMAAGKSVNTNSIKQIPLIHIANRLLHAPDILHCIQVVEPYLLFLSEKSQAVPTVIEKAAGLLERYHQLYPIKQLARENYLSLRQLERCFIRYVGISPKSYYRMNRFLQLLEAKNNDPEQKWGSLAHQFGYYDQMHLIKDFKDFLRITPSSFISSDFAF